MLKRLRAWLDELHNAMVDDLSKAVMEAFASLPPEPETAPYQGYHGGVTKSVDKM